MHSTTATLLRRLIVILLFSREMATAQEGDNDMLCTLLKGKQRTLYALCYMIYFGLDVVALMLVRYDAKSMHAWDCSSKAMK